MERGVEEGQVERGGGVQGKTKSNNKKCQNKNRIQYHWEARVERWLVRVDQWKRAKGMQKGLQRGTRIVGVDRGTAGECKERTTTPLSSPPIECASRISTLDPLPVEWSPFGRDAPASAPHPPTFRYPHRRLRFDSTRFAFASSLSSPEPSPISAPSTAANNPLLWTPIQVQAGFPLNCLPLCKLVCHAAGQVGFLTPSGRKRQQRQQLRLHQRLSALTSRFSQQPPLRWSHLTYDPESLDGLRGNLSVDPAMIQAAWENPEWAIHAGVLTPDGQYLPPLPDGNFTVSFQSSEHRPPDGSKGVRGASGSHAGQSETEEDKHQRTAALLDDGADGGEEGEDDFGFDEDSIFSR